MIKLDYYIQLKPSVETQAKLTINGIEYPLGTTMDERLPIFSILLEAVGREYNLFEYENFVGNYVDEYDVVEFFSYDNPSEYIIETHMI